MKIGLYLLLIVVFAGCNATEKTTALVSRVPSQENIVGLDFREYSENGFLFTPLEYNSPYDMRGYVSINVTEGATRECVQDNYTKLNKSCGEWVRDGKSVDDAIRALYEQSVAMGADAIMMFKYDFEWRDIETQGAFEVTRFPSYFVSGYAIQRKSEAPQR